MGIPLLIVRAILVTTWFFGLSFVFLIYAALRPRRVANGVEFCRVHAPVGVKLMGVRMITRHIERLEQDQPYVLVSNHQSNLDIYFHGYVYPPNAVTIGKKSLRWMPLFGWFYWLCGHLFIDRGARESAMETMQRAARMLVERKVSVFLFPEGTRSKGRGLLPFKKGAFHLAVESGYPLKILVLSSYFGRLKFGQWHSGTVIAEVLEPIATRGRTVEELMAEARSRMETALARLDREVAALTS